ncbi:MAG: amidohydrolase family protein [Terriglobia bacterium]|jgi:predicted TIM-barrel fold metal-dependent hydrolase
MNKNEAGIYIDAHVHVWTNDLHKYPLSPGVAVQDVKPEAYLPEEILSDARPCGIGRIVLVQMSYYGYDNSFMLEVIKRYPTVFRGIAVVDGRAKDLERTMRSLARVGVRGFRLYPEEISHTVLEQAGFQKMFRCAAEDRLSLCLLMNPDSLAVVNRQCRKYPDTPVVIDHLSRIGMGGSIREADVQALCRLAKHPEVRVKLSGFYALGQAKPPHLDLGPLIKRVCEAFGAKRLMWGSDCPFQVMHESYEDAFSLIREQLDFISKEDKDWILGRTAEELFFH